MSMPARCACAVSVAAAMLCRATCARDVRATPPLRHDDIEPDIDAAALVRDARESAIHVVMILILMARSDATRTRYARCCRKDARAMRAMRLCLDDATRDIDAAARCRMRHGALPRARGAHMLL